MLIFRQRFKVHCCKSDMTRLGVTRMSWLTLAVKTVLYCTAFTVLYCTAFRFDLLEWNILNPGRLINLEIITWWEQALFNLEIKKKSGSSINPDIHDSSSQLWLIFIKNLITNMPCKLLYFPKNLITNMSSNLFLLPSKDFWSGE